MALAQIERLLTAKLSALQNQGLQKGDELFTTRPPFDKQQRLLGLLYSREAMCADVQINICPIVRLDMRWGR